MPTILYKSTFSYLFRSKSQFISTIYLKYSFISTTAYTDTLQYRILNYFENQSNIQKLSQKYEVSRQIREQVPDIKNARQTFVSILEEIHQLSAGSHIIIDEEITKIDEKCVSLLQFLTHAEILELMNVFLKNLPSRMVLTDFYKNSLKILYQALDNCLLSHGELLQLLFYIALKKDEHKILMKHFRSYLPDIQNLPLLDQCILAESFYKSSTKLEPHQSLIYEKLVEEKCEELIHDPGLLVTVCKIIRISGPSQEFSLKNFSRTVTDLKEPLNFTALSHLLSLYAEALLYEPQAIQCLFDNSLNIIRKDGSTLRSKDFDRFLWSISRLGYNLTSEEKDILSMLINEKTRYYRKKENLGIFVNSLLSLCILGSLSKSNVELVETCFKEGTFEPVFREKFHWKIRSRLQLFLNVIAIQKKLDVPDFLHKQIQISCTVSEEIKRVAEVAQELMEKGIIKNAMIECPINSLKIPGVTFVASDRVYHVDVYNDLTCLKNQTIPHGLMKLKEELLDIKRYKRISIDRKIVETLEDEVEIQSQIEKRILMILLKDKI